MMLVAAVMFCVGGGEERGIFHYENEHLLPTSAFPPPSPRPYIDIPPYEHTGIRTLYDILTHLPYLIQDPDVFFRILTYSRSGSGHCILTFTLLMLTNKT